METTNLFSVTLYYHISHDYIYLKCNHMICVVCDWLLLLSIMLLKYIHFRAWISVSFFLFPNNIALYSCAPFCFALVQLINISADLTCWLLWIMLLRRFVHKFYFWQMYVFISLGYTHRSGIAESYGNSMFTFLRNWQTVFQSNDKILHSYQQYKNFLFLHILIHTCYCLRF